MDKTIEITKKYDRELNDINNKLKQLEEGRVYDPNAGNCSKMDGSLYTNINQLRNMITDLIDKIEYNKPSDSDKIAEAFRNFKI